MPAYRGSPSGPRCVGTADRSAIFSTDPRVMHGLTRGARAPRAAQRKPGLPGRRNDSHGDPRRIPHGHRLGRAAARAYGAAQACRAASTVDGFDLGPLGQILLRQVPGARCPVRQEAYSRNGSRSRSVCSSPTATWSPAGDHTATPSRRGRSCDRAAAAARRTICSRGGGHGRCRQAVPCHQSAALGDRASCR